jgi:hypothetical protein
VLRVHYKRSAKASEQDLLNSLNNPDWGSKVNASVTWLRGPWTSTVQVTHYHSCVIATSAAGINRVIVSRCAAIRP